ncbi:MAG: hypothetical protein ACREMU_12460, partial [Gemmatimonadaceae bacterium]
MQHTALRAMMHVGGLSMRSARWFAVAAFILAACGPAAQSAHNAASTTRTGATGTPPPGALSLSPPQSTRTLEPIYTPVPEDTLDHALRACLDQSTTPADAPTLAASLKSCLADNEVGVDTLAVTGDVPAVFVE